MRGDLLALGGAAALAAGAALARRGSRAALRPVAALYIDRERGPYAHLPGVTAWGIAEDATKYAGPNSLIAHPPCGHWGNYSAKAHDDGHTGPIAVAQVRKWGGVLEHPRRSKLWKACGIPLPGEPPDAFGGYTLLVDQHDWGHVAQKATWLYVVGVKPEDIPPLPPHLPPPPATVPGRVSRGVVERMAKSKRHLTPPLFAAWLVELARRARVPGRPAGSRAQGPSDILERARRLQAALSNAGQDVAADFGYDDTDWSYTEGLCLVYAEALHRLLPGSNIVFKWSHAALRVNGMHVDADRIVPEVPGWKVGTARMLEADGFFYDEALVDELVAWLSRRVTTDPRDGSLARADMRAAPGADPAGSVPETLQRAVAIFEEVGREIYPADGIWSCNGGAAVFAWICDRLGIPRRLRVGLYWWGDDEESLRRKRDLMGAEDLDLDEVWRDEHHHWVEVILPDGSWRDGTPKTTRLIVDPNGEIRGEPRVSNWASRTAWPEINKWGRSRHIFGYEVKTTADHFLVYKPTDSPRAIGRHDTEVARGLERVDAILGVSGTKASKPAAWPR